MSPPGLVQADGVPSSVEEGLFERMAATARAAAGGVPIEQSAVHLGRGNAAGDGDLPPGDAAGDGDLSPDDRAGDAKAWFLVAAGLAEGSGESAAPVGPAHAGATASLQTETWLEEVLASAGPQATRDDGQGESARPPGDAGVPEESVRGFGGENAHYVPLAALGLLGSLPGRPGDAGMEALEATEATEAMVDSEPLGTTVGRTAAEPVMPVPGRTTAAEAAMPTQASEAPNPPAAPVPSLQRGASATWSPAGSTPQVAPSPGLLQPTPAVIMRPAGTLAMAAPRRADPAATQADPAGQPADAAATQAGPAAKPAGTASRPIDPAARALTVRGRVTQALPSVSPPALDDPGVAVRSMGPAQPAAAQGAGLWSHEPSTPSLPTQGPSTPSLPAQGPSTQSEPTQELHQRRLAAARPAWQADIAQSTAPVAPKVPSADGVHLTFELAAAAREANGREPITGIRGQVESPEAGGTARAATLWTDAGGRSPIGFTQSSSGWREPSLTEQLPPAWDLAGRAGQPTADGDATLTGRPGFDGGSRWVARMHPNVSGAQISPGASAGQPAEPDWIGHGLAGPAPASVASHHSPKQTAAARTPIEQTVPAPHGEQPATGDAPLIATRAGSLAWALRGHAPKVPLAAASAPSWPLVQRSTSAESVTAPPASPATVQEESRPREPGRAEQPWWFRALAQPARSQAGSQSEGERVVGADARPVDPARAGQPRNESAEGGFSHGLTQGLTEEPAPRPSHPGTVLPPVIPPVVEAGTAPATSAAGRADPLGAAWRALDSAQGMLDQRAEAVGGQTAYWIRASLRAGRRETAVTLDPPELGRLRISLVQDGPLVTARIRAELPEVESLLRQGSERIRERLNSQGVRVDALVIEAAPARAARVASAPETQSPAQDRPGAETASHGGHRHPQRPSEQPVRENVLRPNESLDPRPLARGRAAAAAPAARQAWAGLDVRA